MFLSDIACLVVAAACATAAPAAAQAVPTPLPRPANLRVAPAPIAPVAAVPAAAAPAQPVAVAPTAAPQAPAASIGDIAAATAPAESPPPATPAPDQAAPATEAPAVPVPTPAPQSRTAAVEWTDTPESAAPAGEAVPAPLDLTSPRPAAAPAPQLAATNPVDTPAETKTIGKVNTYFNGIRTLQGTFTQIGPDGSRADGKFFLAKPGKLRFYYQRPSTTDIIADGKSLVVRDRKLATQDVYPLSQTPLKFLLDANLDLARDSKVVGVYEEPGLVSVAIEEETTFGGKARVQLVFGTEDNKTYELKQWTITDPQGLDTTVAVSDLDSATKPDDKLFAVDYTRYDRSKRR